MEEKVETQEKSLEEKFALQQEQINDLTARLKKIEDEKKRVSDALGNEKI